MLIELPIFKGEIPIVDPKQLPLEHAQVAINADLSQNTLKPFYEIGDAKTLNTTAWRSIFPVKHSGATFWLCSEKEISAINIPIQEGKGRICYTDGVKPKETDFPLASNDGAGTYGVPNTAYCLGFIKPDSTFVAEAKEATDKKKGDLIGSIAYVYTFVSDWGYESEPSDPTAIIDISEGQYVELKNFEIPVPTNYNIIGIRIYRTATGTLDTDFQLISKIMVGGESPDYITPAEITANGSVWDDKDIIGKDEIIEDANLNEVLASANYIQPPFDLEGLITLPNAVTVGYRGKEVYLSEPYIHYGYPVDYRVITDFDIKSIGWYGTTIVVGTEGYPYKVNGYDPQNVSIEKQPDKQACLFSRAMVSGPRFVLYPSPDGLYMISDEGNRNVTAGIFTKEQWRDDVLTNLIAYDKTIVAFLYDGKYYAFFEGTNDGFIIDFRSASQYYARFELDSDLSVYGGYVDLIDDTLYLLVKSGSTYYVKEWEGFNNLEIIRNITAETEDKLITEAGDYLITTGTSGITEDTLVYQWKSRIFVTSHAFFSCMKIDGDFVTDVTGTGLIVSSGTTVTGTGTSFTTELEPGYVLYSIVLKEYREIASIESDTSLTLVVAFSSDVYEPEYYEDEGGLYYKDELGVKYHVEIPIAFRYNTTMLNIYKNDSLFFTRAINSTNPFRLPSGTGKDWEIEVKGVSKVVNIKMAQSMSELA